MKNNCKKIFLMFGMSAIIIGTMIWGMFGRNLLTRNDKHVGRLIASNVDNLNAEEGGGIPASCPTGCNCNTLGKCLSCKSGYTFYNNICIKNEVNYTITFNKMVELGL